MQDFSKINATLLKGHANPNRRGEKKINPKCDNACYVYAADSTILENKDSIILKAIQMDDLLQEIAWETRQMRPTFV